MPRALLSVSDKTQIVDLAHALVSRGFDLVSTGGTARVLVDAGLPTIAVSDLTRFPEMMDGRVKTLHPAVHGAILARRDHAANLASAAAHGIELIDLVVVNLYPFRATAERTDASVDELVEQIDIGGPSLIRAAAKNFRDVLVVVQPADYARVIEELDRTPSLAFRHELMVKAFAHTADYDAAIAREFQNVQVQDGSLGRGGGQTLSGWCAEPRLEMAFEKIRDLRYGENPHQPAAWYRPATAAGKATGGWFGQADVLQGAELSYTNLLDLDAAVRFVLEFDEPAAAVIKHTNPCGVAIGDAGVDAYVRAREADRMASFGGIVAINRTIDVAAAEAIVSTKIDAVIAPAVDDDARPILARKGSMRVVVTPIDAALDGPGGSVEWRSIKGALLVQATDRVEEARHPWRSPLPDGVRVVTKRQPMPNEWEALRFAWRIAAHVKSNAIVFTDDRQTLAIGAGQMSRVDAANVAVMKARSAGVLLAGSAAASDAFIPFRDGLDAIAAAGATAVVQPGGSVKDADVIAAADEHGLAMVFTGRRHFRH